MKTLLRMPKLLGLVIVLFPITGCTQSNKIVTDATYQIDVKVPMRDGVELATDVIIPKGKGPFPVILWRNPYDKKGVTYGQAAEFVEKGYVAVSQDCRGRFSSPGEWDPFRNEKTDGKDTLDWIAKQPWCNGKVGTMGGSYLGFTQCINAPNGAPMAAMVPIVPWGNTYHDCVYWGGAFRMQLAFGWGAIQALAPLGKPIPDMTDGKVFEKLPLSQWDQQFGVEIPYLRAWIANPTHNSYWDSSEVGDTIADVQIPSLYMGGWYDIFYTGIIDYWNGVRTRSKSEEARKQQYLIMGPWGHGISPKDGKVGDLYFGTDSSISVSKLYQSFLDEFIRGQENGWSSKAPLRLFVMGSNRWRDEQEWPLARAKSQNLYLNGSGPANSLEGKGTLTWDQPGEPDRQDTFVYDPANPVPTCGGALLWPTLGPRDQTEIEKRHDVLVYTTDVLTETVEVTGQVILNLYASSSATDTDFTAKLVDVYPGEGKEIPYNIMDGILRASFRESDTHPSPIEPGKPYLYQINLGYTSNAFLPGHRIRLEVSSSNFPAFDRNLNTGHPYGSDDVMVIANQTVYRNSEKASHLVLPIIPN